MKADLGEEGIVTAPPTAATSSSSRPGSGAFVMPPKNEELKRQEQDAMLGADLIVKLKMEDGREEEMKVKTATEVGYVKILLAQNLGMQPKEVHRIKFIFRGKPMLDPMSLCDHPGVLPPIADVEVKISGK